MDALTVIASQNALGQTLGASIPIEEVQVDGHRC
jgi:hypothetical protein